MSQILFLDIDGVLNSTRYWWTNQPLPMNKPGAIDPAAVARLNRIVEAVDPVIVLSSSWRKMGFETVQAMMVERGFAGRLADQTPMKHGCPRCAEIDAWLDAAHGTWRRFAVLDDDVDAWSDEGPFAGFGLFASTNYLHGLVDEHVPLIVDFLGTEGGNG